MNCKKNIKITKLISIIALVCCNLFCFAQDQDSVTYDVNFVFEEGIYLSFQEYKNNRPVLTNPMKRQESSVFYEDSTNSWLEIDPKKVWGYSYGGNIYISIDDQFWKCINIGKLTQFNSISVSQYYSMSPYGFGGTTVQSKNLEQSFLDMNDGEIKKLNYKNLKPYIEEEPMLSRYIRNNKRAKHKELILVLKAYNELNPLYFPVYE